MCNNYNEKICNTKNNRRNKFIIIIINSEFLPNELIIICSIQSSAAENSSSGTFTAASFCFFAFSFSLKLFQHLINYTYRVTIMFLTLKHTFFFFTFFYLKIENKLNCRKKFIGRIWNIKSAPYIENMCNY